MFDGSVQRALKQACGGSKHVTAASSSSSGAVGRVKSRGILPSASLLAVCWKFSMLVTHSCPQEGNLPPSMVSKNNTDGEAGG